ncbi:hypothetical protein RHMOL_Rhmol08G0160800 [Rhododendron molle]|uniref:Uncharacterized protein n=1 Tax=Rhododendron molle TaxID=49168 RepID=A0ACC0MQD4_RHOML|nr:hypothetical protein RHMOL_Rhmol08G0160800 [Rhododendron molle]
MGHSVEPLDPSTTVGGSVVTSSGAGDIGGSGTGGDDSGPIGSPTRDPARGKGAVVEGEETTEAPFVYREEDVLFWPAATSSCHWPITKQEVAEHLSDEALAQLLEDNPAIGELVLRAKEDRERAIAASEAAERAERERKEREEPLRDMEAEERAEAEARWPRVTAVTEAGAMGGPDFSAEAYVPPTPHLFVPSGFAAYVPQRTEYDDELVLRDPEPVRIHICVIVYSVTNAYTRMNFEQLWAYVVLRMYSPTCKHLDLSTLPRALIWSKKNMGTKEGRGDLNAFRLYLDDLRTSHVYRPEPEYLARSRAVTASRVLLESAFDWQWYVGDRVTRQSLGYAVFQVPNEWVNEALCRMLAMENVIRRAASGIPLELRYPVPPPPQAQQAAAQRPQAQGQVASRSKRTQPPPQKKVATSAPTPPVATRRQTRSSPYKDASQEATR